ERDRLGPELRRVVLHHHLNGTPVHPDRQDPSVSGVQHPGSSPEFTAAGIPEDKIAEIVHRAATEGKYTGYYQGKPPGRPIFEVQYGGQTHYITVSVGDNGFIVGANIRSATTPFKDARRDPRAEADPNYRGWGE
ncbi:hypothetical protein LNK82_07320, partial [Saccharothrix sp. NEAU-S10]|nr:hypothetical protein [Saccharothrix luteola]